MTIYSFQDLCTNYAAVQSNPSIENLQGKVALIIIAHRLQTIEHCQKVYAVREGKIMEQTKSAQNEKTVNWNQKNKTLK